MLLVLIVIVLPSTGAPATATLSGVRATSAALLRNGMSAEKSCEPGVSTGAPGE